MILRRVFFYEHDSTLARNEYRGNKDLDRQASMHELVDGLEGYMEEGTVSLLKNFQELKVDPLEIGGQTMGPASKHMSEEDWIKFWQSAKIFRT